MPPLPLHMPIDPIPFREQLFSRKIPTKWPLLAITRRTDERRMAVKHSSSSRRAVEAMAMSVIIIVIIHKRRRGRMAAVPIRQISILCRVRGSIPAKLWGCMSTIIRIPNKWHGKFFSSFFMLIKFYIYSEWSPCVRMPSHFPFLALKYDLSWAAGGARSTEAEKVERLAKSKQLLKMKFRYTWERAPLDIHILPISEIAYNYYSYTLHKWIVSCYRELQYYFYAATLFERGLEGSWARMKWKTSWNLCVLRALSSSRE